MFHYLATPKPVQTLVILPCMSALDFAKYITTSRRFKCVPHILGSLSIHIFKLLFLLITHSCRAFADHAAHFAERKFFDVGEKHFFCFQPVLGIKPQDKPIVPFDLLSLNVKLKFTAAKDNKSQTKYFLSKRMSLQMFKLL